MAGTIREAFEQADVAGERHIAIAPPRGWINRSTGRFHLRAECPAFKRVRAEDVADAVWREDGEQLRCVWCWGW
jgi:hypothetical protein